MKIVQHVACSYFSLLIKISVNRAENCADD